MRTKIKCSWICLILTMWWSIIPYYKTFASTQKVLDISRFVGRWTGHYECSGRSRGVSVELDNVIRDGFVTGRFSFFNGTDAGDGTFASRDLVGSYSIVGKFDLVSGEAKFIPTDPLRWFRPAFGFSAVGFSGVVEKSLIQFTGTISNPACGKIELQYVGSSISPYNVHDYQAIYAGDTAKKDGDYWSALYWYSTQMQWEDKDAYGRLGLMFAGGLGVKQNYNLAAEYFKKSITYSGNDPDPEIQVALGTLYMAGAGVTQNYQTAMALLTEAWAHHSWDAGVAIAKLYSEGLGVDKNARKSQEWLDKAKERKDVHDRLIAQSNLIGVGLGLAFVLGVVGCATNVTCHEKTLTDKDAEFEEFNQRLNRERMEQMHRDSQ